MPEKEASPKPAAATGPTAAEPGTPATGTGRQRRPATPKDLRERRTPAPAKDTAGTARVPAAGKKPSNGSPTSGTAAPTEEANSKAASASWLDGADAVGAAESALPDEPDEPSGAPTDATRLHDSAQPGPATSTSPAAPSPDTPRHKVAVLGAHLGGAMLAAVLARAGVDVVLVDSRHDSEIPAGETTVPYTAEVFELLARRYGVPELAALGHFGQLPEQVRRTSGLKSSIGFVYARPGARVRPHQVLQFNVPSEHGESHLYRPDVDAWVHRVAVGHGARVPRNRPTLSEVRGEAGDFTVELADGTAVAAEFVVDMSGPDAPMLTRLGTPLRPLRHSSRVLTAHLRGVRPLERRVDPGAGGTPWTGGTTQVVFPGGWIQLVPFGAERTGEDALTSVSVSLDTKLWPQGSASAEEDFQQLVAQFPDLAWQFAEATVVRPWTSAEGWQYAATATTGPGFVVLDRSAVRCDFTLSRDVTLTAELVHAAAAHLIAAHEDGDWSEARFGGLAALQSSLIEHSERLLGTALTATTDFRLWNAFCRVWLLHSMFAALSLKRARNDALASAGVPGQWREVGRHRGAGLWFPVYAGFVALFDDADRLLRQVADQRLAPGDAAERIFGQLRRASFVPPLFGFGDPTDRYYNFTPLKRIKVLLWAKRRAPYAVRRVLTPGATVLPSVER
ncbi:FAD-dependent monooxygenase [Streptomyces sp. NPDC047081]|uniref:NAD(P)/FAD-dependent oxidoreductase n=1 Tax=Streptomyces sp. NPDC047081 TaxID=3154706 RepID=UPI0033DF5885